MSVTDSEMPTESALECESESSTASDSGRESGLPTVPAWAQGSVPAWVPESASGRESVWVRESGLPTVPAWVPESALGLAPGLELDLAPDSVIPVLLARESALALASQLESAPDLVLGSVPGLEPESASGRESGLPTVPAWVPESALGLAPGLELDLAPDSVIPVLLARESALALASQLESELGEDRNQRHLQPLSLPLLRLLPRIYPGK